MEKFYLEEPSLERKQDAVSYIEEHYQYHSHINGSGGLHRYLKNSTYEEWLLKLEKDKNIVPNELTVPNRTYFLVRDSDNKIIGMINIRLALNSNLREIGGHIGYGIRPLERGFGYNKINLYLGLLVCQSFHINRVLLTCVKSNLASSRTMISLGAKLKKEWYESEEYHTNLQMYCINTNESIEEYKDIYEPYVTGVSIKSCKR